MDDKARAAWQTQCPVVQSLERVGERWSMLVLREVFRGAHRFDELQASLGIAPNILSARLARLVEEDFLDKRLYQERPPRHGYHLTDRGNDFIPVLFALLEFGNKHFAPRGRAVAVVDRETTEIAEPVLVDRKTGLQMTSDRFTIASTRLANEQTLAKYPLQACAADTAAGTGEPTKRRASKAARKKPTP
jgi:DNA-binding HxlR family transcriptional regulator